MLKVVEARMEDIRGLLDELNAGAAETVIDMILRARRVFVTGKGRSGLVAGCFSMRLMQMGFEVHVPGESTCPRISEGDLMIAISCSGTTMTTVQMACISREAGAKVVAVTAVPDSPLAQTADYLLVLPVTGESVKKRYRYVLGPHNNTLFEEALFLYLDAMVYCMLEREGIPERALRERHTNLE